MGAEQSRSDCVVSYALLLGKESGRAWSVSKAFAKRRTSCRSSPTCMASSAQRRLLVT